MQLCFAGGTSSGQVRPANQDSYAIGPQGRFFLLADGMGGHAGGEQASRIAVQAIADFLDATWEEDLSSSQLLRKAILRANAAILTDQRQHPERIDMGTTLVAVLQRPNPAAGEPHFWYTHVGDSRLYRLRNHQLEQLTQDHTWIAQAVKQGNLSRDEARQHPWRHVLSQCVGREELVAVLVEPLELQAGDRLLLCSDGLTDEVGDEAIAQLLGDAPNCEAAVAALVSAANTAGGSDNITTIVVGCE
jgi:PPM family protein phosphatase